MADMFADNLVKKCIGEIITHKNTIKNDTAIWKSLTKMMFINYPSYQVYDWVEECLVEGSNEQWDKKKWIKDKTFPKKDIDYKQKRKSVIKIDLRRSNLKKTINDNLKISDVIKSYGIKIKGNKCICPFHNDKNPSLSFNDDKNIFNCFGCSAKGDIIEFIRRMENNKIIKGDTNDNKTTS